MSFPISWTISGVPVRPGNQDKAVTMVSFEPIDEDGNIKVTRADIILYVKRIWYWAMVSHIGVTEAFVKTITHEILEPLMFEAHSYYELLYDYEGVVRKNHYAMDKLGLVDDHIYWMILEKTDDVCPDERGLPVGEEETGHLPIREER